MLNRAASLIELSATGRAPGPDHRPSCTECNPRAESRKLALVFSPDHERDPDPRMVSSFLLSSSGCHQADGLRAIPLEGERSAGRGERLPACGEYRGCRWWWRG